MLCSKHVSILGRMHDFSLKMLILIQLNLIQIQHPIFDSWFTLIMHLEFPITEAQNAFSLMLSYSFKENNSASNNPQQFDLRPQ